MAITSQTVSFEFGKQSRPAYLAQPDAPGVFPGIVVIHEIFGLTDDIRDVASRLANAGYAALAVDLFAGRNRAVCMFRYLSANLRGLRDHRGIHELKAALTFLSRQPGVDGQRLGAIGFCMGGGFAITWAFDDDRLNVIAPFYGTNPKGIEEARMRSCPVVGSYPEKDFTASAGRALKDALDAKDIPNDIKVYPGARHSFFNDRNPITYNPEAAEDAWQRTLTFFAQHLGSNSSVT